MSLGDVGQDRDILYDERLLTGETLDQFREELYQRFGEFASGAETGDAVHLTTEHLDVKAYRKNGKDGIAVYVTQTHASETPDETYSELDADEQELRDYLIQKMYRPVRDDDPDE